MNTAEETLVIILAGALAVFLVLAIIATMLLIHVLKSVGRITDAAEKFMDSAEAMGQVVKHSAEQFSLYRLMRNVAEMVGDYHKKSKKEE